MEGEGRKDRKTGMAGTESADDAGPGTVLPPLHSMRVRRSNSFDDTLLARKLHALLPGPPLKWTPRIIRSASMDSHAHADSDAITDGRRSARDYPCKSYTSRPRVGEMLDDDYMPGPIRPYSAAASGGIARSLSETSSAPIALERRRSSTAALCSTERSLTRGVTCPSGDCSRRGSDDLTAEDRDEAFLQASRTARAIDDKPGGNAPASSVHGLDFELAIDEDGEVSLVKIFPRTSSARQPMLTQSTNKGQDMHNPPVQSPVSSEEPALEDALPSEPEELRLTQVLMKRRSCPHARAAHKCCTVVTESNATHSISQSQAKAETPKSPVPPDKKCARGGDWEIHGAATPGSGESPQRCMARARRYRPATCQETGKVID